MTPNEIANLLEEMRKSVEIPVTVENLDILLLAAEYRNKPWRLVTGSGVFDSDRVHERWIVPVPMEPHGFANEGGTLPNWLSGRERAEVRVYKLRSVRVSPTENDYTAFYEFECSRYA